MGLSFSIGGVSFSSLSRSQARCAVDWDVNEVYDKKKFHACGTDGNFVVRCGRIGGTVTVTVRYTGAMSTNFTNMNSDRDAWKNTAVQAVGPAGETFLRCDYQTSKIVKPMQGLATGGGFMDVQYVFTLDS
jgi:hypothetical protein